MGKSELELDMSELCHAYEDSDREHSYFLDLESEEIIFISHYTNQDKETMEKVESGLGERYIPLPRTTSREGYRDMEDFIKKVGEEDLREKLSIAIDGRGAFRRFKNVLKKHSEERERWFEFKRSRTTKRVRDWLDAEGIGVE